MSPIRYQGRHRKPRASRTTSLIRGGVLSGVVGTVAVTGATTPASATEKPAEATGQLPVLDGALAHANRAAQATQAYAAEAETQDNWQRAQERAEAQARQAAAERRAAAEEAERRAAEEAERRAQEAAQAEAEAQARAQAEAQVETLSEPQTLAAAPEQPATGGGGSGSSGNSIVDFARAQLGDGYSMGSTGPNAWDCSGLVQAAYAQAGISLPRVSGDQSVAGTQVSLDALQAGDILYWGSAGSAYHVAIYTGGGTFIGAQNPSTGVAEHSLDWDMPTGAVRVL
ncbi:C40 family peptidase [Streptomyces marincola]|uniref:C40 family peptidase n=1 Tax=Streptomyces marincola TaxID=2878388 RepID=UPI001CF3094D|nr:C40 family peptidase [Streptomyces marincola]UCM89655.1 C40 family peptidase [Streptomyces marincola]